MAKSRPFKIGDRVRVIEDRWIDRVGYALMPSMLYPEVETDERTAKAWELLGFAPPILQNFIAVIAYARCRQRSFGGDRRQIFYLKHDWSHAPVGRCCTVLRKSIAKTGIYYAGYSGRSGEYGEEYEYEPGGLDEPKTHILLHTDFGIIEACDVELLVP